MSKLLAIVAGLLLLAVLVLFSTTYTVRFHEIAVTTRFGKSGASSIVREPGLHARLPLFAERVAKLDTRLQLIETPLETIATADDQQVLVKAFLFWKVKDEGNGPLDFIQKYGDSVETATVTLTDQFRESVKRQISRYAFDDLVGQGSKLPEAQKAIIDMLAQQTADKGVEPVSAGVSQFLLPPKTTAAVLGRMQATRQTLAMNERTKGAAEATNVRSLADAMAQKILAFVNQRADEIRNQGNAKAAEYMKQMAPAEDFAIFLVQIEALKKALAQYTTLVLPSTQGPFQLLNFSSPLSATGIPQPSDDVRRAEVLPPASPPAVPAGAAASSAAPASISPAPSGAPSTSPAATSPRTTAPGATALPSAASGGS